MMCLDIGSTTSSGRTSLLNNCVHSPNFKSMHKPEHTMQCLSRQRRQESVILQTTLRTKMRPFLCLARACSVYIQPVAGHGVCGLLPDTASAVAVCSVFGCVAMLTLGCCLCLCCMFLCCNEHCCRHGIVSERSDPVCSRVYDRAVPMKY